MIDKTFIDLKKLAKQFDFENSKKVVLMGDCATQHLASAISGCSIYCNLPLKVIDTDYNLIDAQILDESSQLYQSKPDYVIIFMCQEMLYNKFCEDSNKETFAERQYLYIKNIWNTILSKINIRILQFTFVENNDMVFGNFGLKTNISFVSQVKKLNYLLMCGFQEFKNVFPIDLSILHAKYGSLCDKKLYYTAKMPISIQYLPEVANQILTIIKSIEGKFKKCLICDLDNTLWGGVVGDDGLSGIQIGELGLGHSFEDLQRWIKQLKERGIIIAICSKNNETTAKEPFEKHPEMILKLDDISLFVANWQDKATNIKYIQKTLNIGMDSIVFIDDNPFERNLVKTMIPEIVVPDLPEDPANYLEYLKELNLFETASYSENDKNRTKQYQSEISRIESEKLFKNYDDYLINLEMIAETNEFDEYNTPRIAQLSQRSNQFNLRTVRLTEEEVSKLASDNDFVTRYFTLKDKFGDHGLISVVVMKKQDKENLFIDNWLMSCRVLKRGMEEFIINKLVEIGFNLGFRYLIGEYIPTPKNSMVANLYAQMGFEKVKENTYKLDIKKFENLKTFIR